ncbi:hypothetical protein JZU54_00850, partial [bacterium]|nr:hypothetical protein [bacterium]
GAGLGLLRKRKAMLPNKGIGGARDADDPKTFSRKSGVMSDEEYLRDLYKDPTKVSHSEKQDALSWIQNHPEARPQARPQVRKPMPAAVKAGISAAASGAALGLLPAFRRGVGVKTVLKSIAGTAAAGGHRRRRDIRRDEDHRRAKA